MKNTNTNTNTTSNKLYKSLIQFLESNVSLNENETPWITAYNYFHETLKNEESSYIDYIMMVVFNNDEEGYILEHPEKSNMITEYYNRLEKQLTKIS